MLLFFLSLLLGGVVALAVARQGFLAPAGRAWVWFGSSIVALVGLPVLGLLGGAFVVRWFGVCRGRPPTLESLKERLERRRKSAT